MTAKGYRPQKSLLGRCSPRRSSARAMTPEDENLRGHEVSAETADLRPNVTTASRIPDHELLRCIGRGSYGEIWLAAT